MLLRDRLEQSRSERDEIDGRGEQVRWKLAHALDNSAEFHALFGAILAVLVVLTEPTLGVLVLLSVGIVGMWRDILTQGHYFLLGVALVVLVREVAVFAGVVA